MRYLCIVLTIRLSLNPKFLNLHFWTRHKLWWAEFWDNKVLEYDPEHEWFWMVLFHWFDSNLNSKGTELILYRRLHMQQGLDGQMTSQPLNNIKVRWPIRIPYLKYVEDTIIPFLEQVYFWPLGEIFLQDEYSFRVGRWLGDKLHSKRIPNLIQFHY